MKIIPYENNAKIHNEQQIKNVAQSIKDFGFIQPIVVDKNGVIIIGHCRLKALELLGYSSDNIPDEYIKVVDLNETEANRLRLLDNKTNESDRDYEQLLKQVPDLDFSKYDIDWDLPDLEEEVKEDVPPEVDNENPPITKLGDIYQLGEHRLMCGDSTKQEDVEKLMDGEKADLVFTDPPYGVSYKGTNNPNGREWEIIKNDKLRGDELFLFLLEAFKNIKRFLKLGGAFYIWYANSNSIQFETALKGAELKKKQILIWQKGMVLGHSDYHWSYEPCLYGCHPEKNCEWFGDRCQTTYIDLNPKDIEKMKKEEMVEFIKNLYEESDVWKIKRDNANLYVHPTQKPIALSAKAIKNSSQQNNIVLDLFGGSGSTLMGCEQLNRKARLMEFDPKYVDVIIKRWEDFTGKKAVKL